MTVGGKFVWHEVFTKEPVRAQQFYTEFLGWDVEEMDMGPGLKYSMAKNRGKQTAGFMRLEDSLVGPHWLGYVTVNDLETTISRVQRMGGKVRVPITTIPQGQFAIVSDPQGALIAPFKGNGDETATEKPEAGSFCWHELHTNNPSAAKNFYGEIFNWSCEDVDMGGGAYTLCKRADGEQVASIMKSQQRSLWLAYIAVDNVDRSTDQARNLRAKLLVPPADIPGVGRFSIMNDPTGAPFALFKG